MALLQFVWAGRRKLPCRPLRIVTIDPSKGGSADLQEAMNRVLRYSTSSSVSNKYGIGFWKPGAGIIHQVVWRTMLFRRNDDRTDSHTVNAGGLGMVAIGVGGADAVDVMNALGTEIPETDRSEADRKIEWLDCTEGCNSEGCWNPYS